MRPATSDKLGNKSIEDLRADYPDFFWKMVRPSEMGCATSGSPKKESSGPRISMPTFSRWSTEAKRLSVKSSRKRLTKPDEYCSREEAERREARRDAIHLAAGAVETAGVLAIIVALIAASHIAAPTASAITAPHEADAREPRANERP